MVVVLYFALLKIPSNAAFTCNCQYRIEYFSLDYPFTPSFGQIVHTSIFLVIGYAIMT